MYIAYDLETGDLSPDDGDILSGCFLILDDDFKVVEELNLKLKPEGRLPLANPKALAVNGIDIQKHIEDPETVTYKAGREKLLALIKKYAKKRGRFNTLIGMGYNIRGFDNGWIFHHLIDKKTFESYVHYKYLDVADEIDVLKRHEWLPPFMGTLQAAVEYFGVPKRTAHEAASDVRMTVDVFFKIHEFLESKKNGGSGQDLISLLESE